MTDEVKLTTVQIDTDTREKLRLVAETYKRSMAAQIAWMVDKEFTVVTGQPNPIHQIDTAPLPTSG